MPISKTPTTCGPTPAQTLNARINKLDAQVNKLEADDTKALKGGVNGLEVYRQGREFKSTFDSCEKTRAAIETAAKSGDISKSQEAQMLAQVDRFETRSAKSILPVIQDAPWYVKTALDMIPGATKRLSQAQTITNNLKV